MISEIEIRSVAFVHGVAMPEDVQHFHGVCLDECVTDDGYSFITRIDIDKNRVAYIQ